MADATLQQRAQRYAALGEPLRLAMVDELTRCDRTSLELQQLTGLSSNLVAYHLDVLEAAGLIQRCPSSGDRRRRYVFLRPGAVDEILVPRPLTPQPALFICTRNSARSQLAAALWRQLTSAPAVSAGTDPAPRVHRGAVAAARRAGLDLTAGEPRHLDEIIDVPELIVTVCDRAHEELAAPPAWLHWSVPDPVAVAKPAAFDAAVGHLRRRITTLVGRRR